MRLELELVAEGEVHGSDDAGVSYGHEGDGMRNDGDAE